LDESNLDETRSVNKADLLRTPDRSKLDANDDCVSTTSSKMNPILKKNPLLSSMMIGGMNIGNFGFNKNKNLSTPKRAPTNVNSVINTPKAPLTPKGKQEDDNLSTKNAETPKRESKLPPKKVEKPAPRSYSKPASTKGEDSTKQAEEPKQDNINQKKPPLASSYNRNRTPNNQR